MATGWSELLWKGTNASRNRTILLRFVGAAACAGGFILFGTRGHGTPLTLEERAPMQLHDRDGQRWLEQPALGVGMRDPGASFHTTSVLPSVVARALEGQEREFTQTFGFEDDRGSVLVVSVRKTASDAAGGCASLQHFLALTTFVAEDLARSGAGLQVETRDVVRDGRRETARYDALVDRTTHVFVRSTSLTSGPDKLQVDLYASVRPPSLLSATVESFRALTDPSN